MRARRSPYSTVYEMKKIFVHDRIICINDENNHVCMTVILIVHDLYKTSHDVCMTKGSMI
jgi:hypothetical protein